ncbi:type I-G CRISPR-associated protein Cas8g2 [Deferrisoma sp.]
MSKCETRFSVPVDLTNPGQFFACCGLLEVAHRLWRGAQGWFDGDGNAFCIGTAGEPCGLKDIVAQLARANLEGDLSEEERQDLDNLEKRKRDPTNEGGPLSSEEEKRRKSLGKRQREGAIRVGKPFNLRIGWWEENSDDVPKTFAGQQKVLRMVSALHRQIEKAIQDARPFEYRCLLHDEKGKKVEPFYFDAERFAHALDAGFSLDKHEERLRAMAAPLTELLALIGLQRFRPRPVNGKRWWFEYFTWTQPLGVSVAAAVACGAVPLVRTRGFRFRLQFRDDQKRYKAFGIATQIGGDT